MMPSIQPFANLKPHEQKLYRLFCVYRGLEDVLISPTDNVLKELEVLSRVLKIFIAKIWKEFEKGEPVFDVRPIKFSKSIQTKVSPLQISS